MQYLYIHRVLNLQETPRKWNMDAGIPRFINKTEGELACNLHPTQKAFTKQLLSNIGAQKERTWM